MVSHSVDLSPTRRRAFAALLRMRRSFAQPVVLDAPPDRAALLRAFPGATLPLLEGTTAFGRLFKAVRPIIRQPAG